MAALVVFIVGAVLIAGFSSGEAHGGGVTFGEIALSLIPWAVVIFVGSEAVRLLRREARRRQSRRRDLRGR